MPFKKVKPNDYHEKEDLNNEIVNMADLIKQEELKKAELIERS